MKKYINIGIFIFLVLGICSCSDYLNINEDPNTPSSSVATVDQRLPGLQYYLRYAQGCAGARSTLAIGALTSEIGHGYRGQLSSWDPTSSSSTTPSQSWFNGCAANFNDFEAKGIADQAWHYLGVGKIIRAMGFMLMEDWFGETPYTDALGQSVTPKYDDGETIFNGCLSDLDEALKYLDMEQPASAPSLASGDGWNNGDVAKWKKLAYGLKARWLNNLSKKSIYNPDAILAALDNAAKSNAEATVVDCKNLSSDVSNSWLVGDPKLTSLAYDHLSWQSSRYIFVSKWYMDLLTNSFTGGSGIVDPRIDKLVPSAEFMVNGVKTMVRSKPVDVMYSDIRLNNGPRISNYVDGVWKSASPSRPEDTVYVGIHSLGAMFYTLVDGDDTYRDADNTMLSTGNFWIRPDAPDPILTYSELCFIRAEVLFRKGDQGGALIAYQNGIRANMDLMNEKLVTYRSNNPSKMPMAQADIEAYMTSAAVAQGAGELTMAKIMQQKLIACGYNVQNWNDLRRFNYSAGNIGGFGVVYPDYSRPKDFSSSSGTKFIGTSPNDPRYWFRRMAQPNAEVQYNSTNLKDSNPEALLPSIWSYPVWWDTPDK